MIQRNQHQKRHANSTAHVICLRHSTYAYPRRENTLACTSALVALEVNWNRLWEVVAEVAHIFLRKCLSCNDWVLN